MCAFKRIVPVIFAAVVALNGSDFAFAGQDTDQGLSQGNRKQLIETNSCPGCDLSGLDFDRANLTGANLEGANLSKIKLRLATLVQANLRNTDLRDAELGGSDLAEVDLRGADLRGATFTGAYLVGAKLDDGVILNQPSEELVVENVPAPTRVTEDILAVSSQETGFFDKTVQGVKGLFGMGKATEEKVVTKNGETIGRHDEAIPAAVPVQPVVLPPVEVHGIVGPTPPEEQGFFDKILQGVRGVFGLGNSVDHETVAEKTESVVQIEKQAQQGATPGTLGFGDSPDPAAEAEKNRARLLETKRCYGCSLVGVDLAGKKLVGADLEGADLTGSNLQGADLEKANLKGAILVRANLRNADLRRADLYKANLSGADVTGARLEGAFLDDAQLSDLVGYESKEQK